MKRLLKIINEKSTNRRFRKQATMIAGMSAMVVTKMELQRLKEKLPNISIRYTGTWKDSLKFGVGMAATAAGIILALLGGGSEILAGGVSTAVSVPAAASGIAIAGTGLAISGAALANMFDVRIQKSESSKGNGVEESAREESAADFEKRISNLSSEERVAAVKEKARNVAREKGLVKDSKLSKLNGRDIYKDTKTGEYYSVDTQHGRFEHLNKRGSAL